MRDSKTVNLIRLKWICSFIYSSSKRATGYAYGLHAYGHLKVGFCACAVHRCGAEIQPRLPVHVFLRRTDQHSIGVLSHGKCMYYAVRVCTEPANNFGVIMCYVGKYIRSASIECVWNMRLDDVCSVLCLKHRHEYLGMAKVLNSRIHQQAHAYLSHFQTSIRALSISIPVSVHLHAGPQHLLLRQQLHLLDLHTGSPLLHSQPSHASLDWERRREGPYRYCCIWPLGG